MADPQNQGNGASQPQNGGDPKAQGTGGTPLVVDSGALDPQNIGAGIYSTTDANGRPTFYQGSLLSSMPTSTQPSISATPASVAAAGVTITMTASSTPTSAAAASSGSTIQGPLIAAIVVPIVAVLALIPIAYILWLHYRNKRHGRRLSTPDFGDVRGGPPASETQIFTATPTTGRTPSSKLAPVMTPAPLPVPFKESDRIKSGQLGVYEVRGSPDEYRPPQTYTAPPPPPPPAPLIYEHYQQQRQSGRPSSELDPAHHVPSPILPSPPPLNPHARPPSDCWPLNNHAPLPDPAPPYEPRSVLHNKPMPLLPGQRSTALAPSPDPRPPSSDYTVTPTGAAFPAPLAPQQRQQQPPPPQQQQQPRSAYGRGQRQRESDLVSEMSYHEPGERQREAQRAAQHQAPASRSAVSSISMTGGGGGSQRRSRREPDAISEVSELGPDDEPLDHSRAL